MPRYFFNVYDEEVTPDEEGVEYPDLAAARAAALDGARELVCDQIQNGYLNLDHRIEVAGAEGETLLTITFRDAFEIRSAD